MASNQSSLTTLEDLVSCSVCLENFTDPRALPCVHSYCKECLHQLMTPQGMITCPQCRMEFEVPDKDVSNFRPNFYVNNLLELPNLNTLMPVLVSSTGADDQPADTGCPLHTGRICELYCETCSKFICYQCVAKWGDCYDHSYTDAKKFTAKSYAHLEVLSQSGKQRLGTIKQHLSALEDLRAKQVANVAEICENIDATFARHLNTLQTRKCQLVEAAVAAHQKNNEGLENELERIQLKLAKMLNTNELCKTVGEIEDPVVFMDRFSTMKPKFEPDTAQLVSEVDVHEIRFTEDEDLLRAVLSNHGAVRNIAQRSEDKQEKTIEKEEKSSRVQNEQRRSLARVSSGRTPGTSGTAAPQRQDRGSASTVCSPQNAPAAAASSAGRRPHDTPISWKLYPKNVTDQWIAFENKGLTVRTRPLKIVSVIGMPGFKYGRHTWQVKLRNMGGGIGIGVCLGRNEPGLCVMYDSYVSSFFRDVTVTVELDCEKKSVRVTPRGYQCTMLHYCGQPNEVNAYFVLFPSNAQGQLTVAEMDGKAVEEERFCCIL